MLIPCVLCSQSILFTFHFSFLRYFIETSRYHIRIPCLFSTGKLEKFIVYIHFNAHRSKMFVQIKQ